MSIQVVRARWAAAWGALVFAAGAAAAGPGLHVSAEARLTVALDGQPVILRDHLGLGGFPDGARHDDPAPASGWTRVDVLRGGTSDQCLWYREVASRPDRVEITWHIKYPSFKYGRAELGPVKGDPFVEMVLPAPLFDGGSFRAADHGSRGEPGKAREGDLGAAYANGKTIADGLAYLSLTTRGGRALTLNFNPHGPHTMALTYYKSGAGWRLFRDGDVYRIRAALDGTAWGHTTEFKIVVTPEPFRHAELHNGNRWEYVHLRPGLEVFFGSRRPHPRHRGGIAAGVEAWEPGRAFGWLAPDGLSVQPVAGSRAALRTEAVVASTPRPRDFRVRARDGLYLVTVAYAASAPFDVLVNGRRALTGLQPAADGFGAKTTHGRAVDGELTVSFEGPDWRINGLALTPLVYDEEDFLFRRTWWAREDLFAGWFARIEPAPAPDDYAFEPKRPDKLDWAWNARLDSLEGSINGSSRSALDTAAAIGERMAEFAAGGFRGVVVNGAHFRHGLIGSPQHDVLLRNSRLAAETAHRHGLRIFSHHDLNFVHYHGVPRMLAALDRDPDALARNLFNPFDIQSNFCLNSPSFRREVGDYLSGHLRATGMDGYMIDEMTFHGDQYCGCDRCRTEFHRDTGLHLPHESADAQGRFFRDSAHPAWRAWTVWRGRRVAAFVAAVKAELERVNPNVVWMRYSSASFTGPASNSLNLDDSLPWNADHIGDEFHPDDILHNWRQAFIRLKNRQGVAASWGNAPTWYLAKVVSDPSQYLYAWALARMNRGNLWRRAVDTRLSAALHGWADQMDDRHARPLSEVAVLLSQATVDFTSRETRPSEYYDHEHSAWLQTLAEENVQFDVLLERDILAGRLEGYRALVLANTAVMNDELVAAVLSFAERGGRVVAVYETGLFRPDGTVRDEPALAAASGLTAGDKTSGGRTFRTVDAPAWIEGGAATATDVPLIRLSARDPELSIVLAVSADAAGNVVPAVIESRHGRGMIYTIPGNLVSRNFEPRLASVASRTTIGRRGLNTYDTHFDPAVNRWVAALMRRAVGDAFLTRADSLPPGVIYCAFRQTDGGDRSLVLHLLNLQGRPRLQPGDPIIAIRPIPTPPLKTDPVFSVRPGFALREGFVSSPLRPERVAVEVTPGKDGIFRVRMPKEAVENYAVVHLRP